MSAPESFDHPDLAAMIRVFNLVHDLPDEEYPPTRGLKPLFLGRGVRDMLIIKSLSLVFNGDGQTIALASHGDSDGQGRIQVVTVFDRIDQGFLQGQLDMKEIVFIDGGLFF